MKTLQFLILFLNVYTYSYAESKDIIEIALYSNSYILNSLLNYNKSFLIIINGNNIDARDLALFYLLSRSDSNDPDAYKKIKILYRSGAHWKHLQGLEMPSMKEECKRRLNLRKIKKSISKKN